MYKIMFVDDEPLILRRLHQLLNWEELNFFILPDASNGEEALKQMSAELPDIVVCDINMPDMDGLTLARHAKELYSSVHFVILTVNDSFGCAQQALNIGVDHYLLKPIDPSALHTILIQICETLDSSREEKLYLDSLKTKAQLSEQMIREKFINWLVNGRQPLSEEALQERFLFYQIPVHGQKFQILSVHINSLEEKIRDNLKAEELLEPAISIIEDTLSSFSNWVVFSDAFYNLNILLGFSDNQIYRNSSSSSSLPSTDMIGKMLRENLLFHLNLPVTIFYSRCCTGARNLYLCYYETKFLFQYTPDIMQKGVLSFDEYVESTLNPSFNFDDLRTTILRELRVGNIKILTREIDSTLRKAIHTNSLESFNMLRIDFVMTGIMFLQENKISIQDVFQKHFSPLAEITQRNDADSCIVFLQEYFSQILKYIESNKISSRARTSERCMEFVHENLSNPALSVKWLASQLYINENYLSRLFKSETGHSLNRYILKERLITAKHYMDNEKVNLQQIASAVGFTDAFYFSKCFKKEFGVSPSSYLSSEYKK